MIEEVISGLRLHFLRILVMVKEPAEYGFLERIDGVRTRFLPEEEVERIDPEGLSFVDSDTPEDYLRAEETARKGLTTHAD